VAVIAAFGPPAAEAAKVATATIPIVFTAGTDPIDLGLVTNFRRPTGNVTGFNIFAAGRAADRFHPAPSGIRRLRASDAPGSPSAIKMIGMVRVEQYLRPLHAARRLVSRPRNACEPSNLFGSHRQLGSQASD
jgi:hypothetical protein